MNATRRTRSLCRPQGMFLFLTLVVILSFLVTPLGSLARAGTTSRPELMPPHPRLVDKIRSGEVTLPRFMTDERLARSMGIDATGRSPRQINATINALAVVVEFSDMANTVTASFFDSLIFAAAGSSRGSVRDYYAEVSYGQVDIVTVNMPSAIDWVTAPQTIAYYAGTDNCTGTYPNNCQKLAEDIVDAVNGVVDFANYDNDGDGAMEPILLIHAGRGAEYTGAPSDIWSHSWSLLNPRSYDGVTIGDYVIMPEYWASASGSTSDMTIGVFAHEMGHGFWNLPDLYDRDYSSNGVGQWSLMAGGSWNGPSNDGSSPAWPDAWTRVQMGFASYTNVTANGTVSIQQALNNPSPATTILRLRSSMLGPSEFFLVENRQQTVNTYDEYLAGSGLFIYHIDEAMDTYSLQNDYECTANPDCGCSDSQHYLVQVEQADGYQDLEWGSGSDSGDPFPGSSNNRTFNMDSQPEVSSWYSCGNNLISVTNISNSGATMTADVTVEFDAELLFNTFLPTIPKLNSPPTKPNTPSPAHGATGQSTSVNLTWKGGDPNGDAVTYDVFFETGDTSPDVLKCDNAPSAFCDPGNLVANTTYYWQVVARDALGAVTTGPIWNFKTAAAPPPSPVCNGNFEAGSSCWTEYSSHGWDVIWSGPWPGSVTPHSGSYAAWLGGEYDDTSYIQQSVTVSAGSPYLGYWNWIASEDICGFDYAHVLINGDNFTTISLCDTASTGGWVHRVLNLSGYAGQTVTLRIQVNTDDVLNSNYFVDDVAFQSSPSPVMSYPGEYEPASALPRLDY